MPERFECTTLAKKRYINTLPFLFSFMHSRVEHLSPGVEFTCIVLNATVKNVINDFTVTAKNSDPYYTT